VFLKKTHRLTFFVTFLVTVLTGTASYSLINYLTEQRKQQQQLLLSDQMHSYASAIEQELVSTASAAYAIASWLKLQQGNFELFERNAAEIFPYYPHITAISVAPAGVVRAVYPVSGAQNLLGHNIFDDPQQQHDAVRIMQSKLVQLTGPYRLAQGGTGIIGRLPVYLTKNGVESFWGFVNITFHLEKMTSLAQLQQLPTRGIHYALLKQDAATEEQLLIVSSGQTLPEHSSKTTILPGSANWSLYLYPGRSWHNNNTFYRQATLEAVDLWVKNERHSNKV